MTPRVAALLALFATSVLAADTRQLFLAQKAQSDFDRVLLAPRPGIPDAEACMQSEAAALPVSLPEERSVIYYRTGYCTYALAAATRDAQLFQAAAAAFDKAVEVWPVPSRKTAKRITPEPVSTGLRIFAGIARLNATNDAAIAAAARQEITSAVDSPACQAKLMSPQFCGDLADAGTQWLGWLDLRDNQLDSAARRFSAAPDSPWNQWVQGRRDFDRASYQSAVEKYSAAIDRWKHTWQGEGPTFLLSLTPRPQYAASLADLGAARLLAGDPSGATLTLDASLQADSANPHALFLRARAKELAGRKDAALADYNMASRTAFAAAQDLASGEAHLYRGIVLFRRQDFSRAEQEFSSALNFEMKGGLRPDARAWRHLAAVAAGSCGSARQSLNQALAEVSPFFPREEARSLVSACDSASAQ